MKYMGERINNAYKAEVVFTGVLITLIFSASAWTDIPREEAERWVTQGMTLNNNSDEEADCYRKAVEIDPTYANAWFNLGYVYQAQRSTFEAVEAYRKCLEHDPERADACRNLAMLLDIQGDYQGELSTLYRFLEMGTREMDVAEVQKRIEQIESKVSQLKQAEVKDGYTQAEIEEQLSRRFTRGESPYTGPRLPVRIQFAFGSAEILTESKPQLLELARALQSARLEGVNILIEGHTCNIGSVEANRLLSSRRAESVKEFLKKEGVPEERLYSKGKGLLEPIQPNSTEAQRSINRRVEFVNWNEMKTMQHLLSETTRSQSPYDHFFPKGD